MIKTEKWYEAMFGMIGVIIIIGGGIAIASMYQ